MSEQNYALQTEIVRYETTQSDFNSPINKEEKRLIDMMYAFDDETSREVTPQKITEGAHLMVLMKILHRNQFLKRKQLQL